MQRALLKPVKAATLEQTMAEIGTYCVQKQAATQKTLGHKVKTHDFTNTSETDFDIVALGALVGDDIAKRLVMATLNDADQVLEAGRSNDPNISNLAHWAAGSALALGWPALGAALLDIETITRSNSITAAQIQLSELESIAAAMRANLPEIMHAETETKAR